MLGLSDRLLITTWKSFKEFDVALKHQSNNGFSPSGRPALKIASARAKGFFFFLSFFAICFQSTPGCLFIMIHYSGRSSHGVRFPSPPRLFRLRVLHANHEKAPGARFGRLAS